MFDADKFGFVLRQYRTERGLGLREFSRALKLSPTTLARLEADNVPDMKTFAAILSAMGWRADPFFTQERAQ